MRFFKVILASLAIFIHSISAYAASNAVYDQASEIQTDTSSFDNNLSSADTDVQKALETLDALFAEGIHFYFTATEGQTEFTLPSTPNVNAVFVVYINGVGQSETKGDFTISGTTLTFSSGLDAGDIVAGAYGVIGSTGDLEESDTLATVTARGNTTSTDIHVTTGTKIFTDDNSYHYTDAITGFVRFFHNSAEIMRFEHS